MIEMIGAEGNLNDELIILGFIGRSDNSYGTTPMCSTPAWSRDLEATDSSLDRVVAESSVFYGQTSFIDGVLLKCADLKPLFSFLHYSLIKQLQNQAPIEELINELNSGKKSLFGVYEELYSLRKTTQRDSHLPSHRHAGFIIISFKVLDGQTNLQSLEKSWLAWTGAREIYKYSPRNWNLRQISFLRLAENKNLVGRPFPYVVTCEFGTIFHPSNRLKAMDLCERLRIRNCGYISLYQVQGSFANNHIGITPNKDSNKSGRRTMLRGFSLDVTEAGNSSRRHKSPRLHGRNRSIIYNHEENCSYPFSSHHDFFHF